MVVFFVVVQDGEAVLTPSIAAATLQGLLAQRLAQGTHNPWVLGSNPGGPTRFFSRSGNLFGLFPFFWQHFPESILFAHFRTPLVGFQV